MSRRRHGTPSSIHMDPINLTIDPPFHSSVWIGAGKRFSNSIPHEVLIAKERTLEIPETFRGHLPPPTAYVRDFVGLDLPFQSDSLDLHATTEWFSHDTSHTDPNVLITRPAPSAKVLETLEATVGQVWLDVVDQMAQKKAIETALEKCKENWPLYSGFSPKNGHLPLRAHGTMTGSKSGRKFCWWSRGRMPVRTNCPFPRVTVRTEIIILGSGLYRDYRGSYSNAMHCRYGRAPR